MALLAGLEPATSRLGILRAIQLRHKSKNGASDRIRTCDLRVRSATLYSTELQRQLVCRAGIEPATNRLKIDCSTTELPTQWLPQEDSNLQPSP